MPLILFSMIFILLPTQAYQEITLKPVYINKHTEQVIQQGRTYNYHPGSRIIASKEKTFPILEQFETLLFPQKDFKKEPAKARLERIEIAVHGNTQNGSIKHRLNLLENEISSWQIANYQTLAILNSNKKETNAFNYPQASQTTRAPRRPANRYSAQSPYQNSRQISLQQRKTVDYDYENFRMAKPIINDIGRRSVRAIFDL